MFFYFVGEASMYKRQESFWLTSTSGPIFFHYSEPSNHFFYSESRLLMDYSFQKKIERVHVFIQGLVKD